MEKAEKLDVSEEEIKKIISNWSKMSKDETMKYCTIFPKMLDTMRDSPIAYVNFWQSTPWELQEANPDMFLQVVEMAKNIPNGFPYLGIWKCTSSNLTSTNPTLIENAIKDGMRMQSNYGICPTTRIELERLYLGARFEIKDSNPEMFNSLAEYIKRFPELVADFSFSPVMRESFSTEEYAKALATLQHEGVDISDKLLSSYPIEIEELKRLKDKLPDDSLFFSQNVCLEIRDASELPLPELEELCKRFSVDGICMNEKTLDKEQKSRYSVAEYTVCRERIDELLEGVVIPNEGGKRERQIFGQVIKRLARHIQYDHSHIEESDRARERIKDINGQLTKAITEDERAKLSVEIEEAWTEYEAIDHVTPRNMVGGLVRGTCVCSGYAEIVRNVFACLGIEAKYMSGFPEKEDEYGHAWNQIKLDGVWYNMDLTWDRDRLVNDEVPQYLLCGDTDFNKYGGHEVYSRARTANEERCRNTLSGMTVQGYCNFRPRVKLKDKCKQWLTSICKHSRISKVQEVENAVIEAGNRARGRTYDKDERDR